MKWLQGRKRVQKSKQRWPQRVTPWSAVCLLACGVIFGMPGPGVESQAPPGARRGRTTAPPPPAEKSPGVDDYRYSAQARRDPLAPLLVDLPPDTLQPRPRNQDRPLGPLERFDLAALKLVGIVSEVQKRTGLIKGPDGKSYFALLETYMGKYGGKVIAIESDHLIIEEEYINAENKVVPKTLTIPLRRKDKKEG